MGVHTVTHTCGHDYGRLAREIIAERDARKKEAGPDKIAPNGKKRPPSKEKSRLLRSGVYVNNATRDFMIVDKREADENALFLDGYLFCCALLADNEEITAEVSRFQDAARAAEKLAGSWDTPDVQKERRAINAEDCFSGISDEMAVAALYKYWYIDRHVSLPPFHGVWDAYCFALHARDREVKKTGV